MSDPVMALLSAATWFVIWCAATYFAIGLCLLASDAWHRRRCDGKWEPVGFADWRCSRCGRRR